MNKLTMDNTIINVINDSTSMTYELKDNQNIIINYYNEDEKDIDFNIIQNNNSLFVINYSSIIKNDCKINFNVKVLGNNNKLIINGRLIGNDNNGFVKAVVNSSDKALNNEITENIKVLNENGTIIVEPILEINNNEATANHFVTIGSVDKNELFYLQTKGLSYNASYNLLKLSFIYNIFNEDFISLLNNRKERNE